jgi:hypothetical protein
MLVCHPVKDFVTALRPDIAKRHKEPARNLTDVA